MSAPKKTSNPPSAWGPLRHQSEHPMLVLTYGEAAVLDLTDDAADSYLWAC